MSTEFHQTDSDEELACRQLQRQADRIVSLIVASDWAAIDVVIEIRKLKEFVEMRMPDRTGLFETIYESRFKRLWGQFRGEGEGPLPEW